MARYDSKAFDRINVTVLEALLSSPDSLNAHHHIPSQRTSVRSESVSHSVVSWKDTVLPINACRHLFV